MKTFEESTDLNVFPVSNPSRLLQRQETPAATRVTGVCAELFEIGQGRASGLPFGDQSSGRSEEDENSTRLIQAGSVAGVSGHHDRPAALGVANGVSRGTLDHKKTGLEARAGTVSGIASANHG